MESYLQRNTQSNFVYFKRVMIPFPFLKKINKKLVSKL